MAKAKSARKTPPATQAKRRPVTTAKKPVKQTRPRRPKSAKAAQSAGPAKARSNTKQSILIDLLRRPHGATIADLVKATGWQAHSVRGAISGTLKKKLGLAIASEAVEGRGRVYRIAGHG